MVFQNINLQGAWKENSGKLWYCKQKGNTFKWTQVDSNREAKGVIVGNLNALQNFGEEEPCSIYITFDESVHWKLTPSVDFNYLIGPKDTFIRVYQKKPLQAKQVVESLRGTEFIENSGKIWSVTHVNESSIQLLNKHDGRVAEGHFVKDEWSGKYVVYINFHNYDGDDLLRIETNDWNTLILSNDDVFKRLL